MYNCPFCHSLIPEYNLMDGADGDLSDGDYYDMECSDCGKLLSVTVSVSYDFEIERAECDNHVVMNLTMPDDLANGKTRTGCSVCNVTTLEISQNGILELTTKE